MSSVFLKTFFQIIFFCHFFFFFFHFWNRITKHINGILKLINNFFFSNHFFSLFSIKLSYLFQKKKTPLPKHQQQRKKRRIFFQIFYHLFHFCNNFKTHFFGPLEICQFGERFLFVGIKIPINFFFQLYADSIAKRNERKQNSKKKSLFFLTVFQKFFKKKKKGKKEKQIFDI